MADDTMFGDDGEPTEAARPDRRARDAARDDALERVETHADTAWKDAAARAVRELAEERAEFTADDVQARIPDDVGTHDTRALGPVMLTAARAGLIESTDRSVTSERRHGGLARVWRSTSYEGPAPTDPVQSALRARIAELEADNERLRRKVRKLKKELRRGLP